MRKIRTLIVDDEPLAREGIALLLKGDGEVEIVGACADGRAALEEIRAKRPDLVFLDIQMPRLGGLETLNALPRKEWPAIIFVTAYEKYAIRAFDLCAVDYLLKPFRDARFHSALNRAKEQIRRPDFAEMQRRAGALLEHLRGMDAETGPAPSAGDSNRPARLCFRVGHDHLFVDAADILWVEAHGNSVRLGVNGQVHAVRETLQSLERRLDSGQFLRVHRSFMVNVEHIRRIKSALYGDHLVLMSDGAKIPLSRNYRSELKSLLDRDIPPGQSPAGSRRLQAAALAPERPQREAGHPGV